MLRYMNQIGGISDFLHFNYARTAVGGPAAISNATLAVIENTPMFNPFQNNTVIPGSSGIVPSGSYIAIGGDGSSPKGKFLNLGKMKAANLRSLCNELKMTCRLPNGRYLPKSILITKISEKMTGKELN